MRHAYVITQHMRKLHRSLARLESQRPVTAPAGRMISFAELDPAMATMFLTLDF